MKAKKISIILGIFVGSLMLMQSVLGATGPLFVWANQTTLSNADSNPSQDPENSGFGMTQVTVWEEWNGADWDIYMKYNTADGLPVPGWFSPPTQPATTPGIDEKNPAVSVSRPVGGLLQEEIHVVYQQWNPAGGIWEICHTYTTNFGVAWVGPVVISSAGVSSTNPACVYTEDHTTPRGLGTTGRLVQMVWEETLPLGGTRIGYRAYAYDPSPVFSGYVPVFPGPPFWIRVTPFGLLSKLPEIASVDERSNGAATDFQFSIVWQETNAAGNWNVGYVDGTTQVSAIPRGVALTPGSLGILNAVVGGFDHTDPDIAASQDYQPIGIAQSYFFHVDYVKQGPNPGGGTAFSVEQCYSYGGTPTPGSAAFTGPASVHVGVTFAVPPPVLIDNPTVATKLTSVVGALPITFQTWFAWEDNIVVATTDIWYRVGFYTTGPPPAFGYAGIAGARVPYLPLAAPDIEQNPEFWNREDALRLNPPVTHLVFDRANGPAVEVEYIDP